MISSLDKLHYSFCGDLGDKATVEIDWPVKINFALFTIQQLPDLGDVGTFHETDWTQEIKIPGIYSVEKITSFNDLKSLFKQKEYQTFLAPSDYSTNELFYKREKQLLVPIPNEVFQHPHLPIHATFQFYFLNNSLFTANLPYLEIGDFQNNGSKQIRVRWIIRANPAGTYVIFRSGHIFFQWKIEVRQGIVNMTLVKVAIEGLSKMMGGLKKVAGSFFGIDSSGTDEAQKDLAQNLVGRDRGSSFMERERSQRIQEQQTARMFTSTLQHTGDQVVEPSVFYANTVKFPYNLFDFWLRVKQEPFACRIHYSNNLLNNLIHNNNENPITYPLNITFEKLAQILKPGFIQSRLDLDYDPNNRMAECFARGVTFYKDKKEHFVNPNLGVKEAVNIFQYSSFGHSHGYTAQAITEGGEGISIDIPYTAEDRGYSHTTFIRLTNPSVQDNLRDALVAGCGAGNEHYYPEQGFCWGCTYDGLKAKGFVSIKFTPSADCSMILKLDKNSTAESTFDLKAGVEYDVTISETQFIFKSEGKTKLVIQQVPGHDDFNQLDWTPPPGSGGDIEIPLEDPEISLPEPGEGDHAPEDDFTPDTLDISGGEVEIPQIEIDLPPDITQDLDNSQDQDPDPPPIDIDHSQDQDNSQDQDQSQDTGDQDRGSDDPPPPDTPDDDDDAD